jgi:hypothetical protein
MILPYHLTVDLYTRAAIGEHFAFVWLPLAMFFAENMAAGKRSGTPGFAISFALLLMSHLFTALLFLPVAAAWCYLQSEKGEHASNLLRFATATALSTGLAAVYLVPLASQRRYFDHRMLELDGSKNYVFHSHFAFMTESFLRYAQSLAGRIGVDALALSLIPAALLGLGVTAVVIGRIAGGGSVRRSTLAGILVFTVMLAITAPWSGPLWRSAGLIARVDFDQSIFVGKMFFTTLSTALLVVVCAFLASPGRHRRLLLLCMAIAAGALFMALPYSRPIWESVPHLALLEFPWRFNTLLTFSATVLTALAFDALLRPRDGLRKAAAVVFATLIAAVSFGNAALHNVQNRFLNPHRFSQRAGIEVLLRTYARSQPVDWVRKNERLLNTRPFVELTSDNGKASYWRVGPREIRLDVSSPNATGVKIKQLFYPGWRALANSGQELRVTPSIPEGALAFSLPPGQHRIRVVFPATHAEIAGALISLSAVLSVAMMLLIRRRRHNQNLRMQVKSSA